MKVAISDRELLSVLGFARSCPPGEQDMEVGLQMVEAFGFENPRWDAAVTVTANGLMSVHPGEYSNEPKEYDLSDSLYASLRTVLSRPGQAPAMWLASARVLRRFKEASAPAVTASES